MAKSVNLLAFDIGAESGRVILGRLDRGFIRLEEIYRFPNGPVPVFDHIYWDFLRLWNEMRYGLSLAAQVTSGDLTSLGVDTWGVDFALLGDDDTLVGNPHHHRDKRTDGIMEYTFQRVPREEIYQTTGIQFMQINSLFQLVAMVKARSPALAYAKTFLGTPELFNFWLSGVKASEFTHATTTQCYNPITGKWAYSLLKKLEIPAYIFGEIVPPGVVLGTLLPSVARECRSPEIPVITTASHDTGSAVAAVPTSHPDYIYISSGTWSLMGVEVHQPVITPESLAYNLTNEGGAENTFRLLRNIMGLWILQECRREWTSLDQTLSYDDLTTLAAKAPPFGSIILANEPRFLHPNDMPARVQAFCAETNQLIPQTKGEIARCVLESLALEYRWVAEGLEKVIGRPLPTIHIIGGGSRNRLLNQFTADATAKTVISGPSEATSIGNILVQAIAMGEISSIAEGRDIVCNSCEMTTYEPHETAAWDEAYARYLKLKELFM